MIGTTVSVSIWGTKARLGPTEHGTETTLDAGAKNTVDTVFIFGSVVKSGISARTGDVIVGMETIVGKGYTVVVTGGTQ